jgi:hypothetical protein
MADIDMSRYVTRDELAGLMAPLGEIRGMLREEIRGLGHGQEAISDQIAEMKKEITDRQDTANGRTSTLEKRLADTLTELHTVAGIAEHIDTEGCSNYTKHDQMLRTLAAAGVLSAEDEADAEARGNAAGRLVWTTRHKATTAGITGAAVLLALLGSYGIPMIHRFIHWLLGTTP